MDQNIVYQLGMLQNVWVYATDLTSSHSVAIMINCKDIMLSSSMLQKSFHQCREENDQMSTGGMHKTVPVIWQILILVTQNSALHSSYEQETDKSSNLEVWDNLNYAMALEGELPC